MDTVEKKPRSVAEQQIHDRLRRVEGQVRGISRMVEEERACPDIVTQLMAVRAALDRVTEQIITSHVDTCLENLPPNEARSAVAKAIKLLARIEH